MTPNPKLLVFLVSAGLVAMLALYLLSWVSAARQQSGALLVWWALGSIALAFSTYAPWIFRISLQGGGIDGFFAKVTSVFLVFTTMSAFIFPLVIAGAALAVSAVLYVISKVII